MLPRLRRAALALGPVREHVCVTSVHHMCVCM
jgi:hypothetical protein